MSHHFSMATYAIGDIQGCWETLQDLLTRIAFKPDTDRLWLTGDLVNRGPRSLDVLRWARQHDEAITVVLGNHDLHLLARAEGVRTRSAGDTLHTILDAPDCDSLLRWLVHRPLLYREDHTLLVHAGLLPAWDVATAEHHARTVETQLRGSERAAVLTAFAGACPDAMPPPEHRAQRAAFLLHAFTRLRICTVDGRMNLNYSGPVDDIPTGHLPWFQVPNRRSKDHRIVFGHWAALGLHNNDGVLALDTGCVWRRSMTAVRLDDGAIFQAPCADMLESGH